MKIPKILGHIWIGPHPAPSQWLNTWKEKHPDWTYRLYDNDFLQSFNFRNKNLIDTYIHLELYAGATDLMRYEILYEFGGFIPEADSICYLNTEELFTKPQAYTVYENEFLRGKLVSPILACEPKNIFVKQLIDELSQLDPQDLGEPWKTTGNLFVAKMIEKYNPDITIFPSHYFIPVHFDGMVYTGSDKIYCQQLFGTTRTAYQAKKQKQNFIQKFRSRSERARKRDIAKQREQLFQKQTLKHLENFNIDFSTRNKSS